MQQLFRRLILYISIAALMGILPQKGYATHLVGSDISYTCLGGNKYRVNLTFYRDCLGSQNPNGVDIEFRSTSCNKFFTATLLLVSGSGQEITYPCPGLRTACDNPPDTTNPGIQEYKYSGIVNFPAQCADWVISWSYCCRNCAITTMVNSPTCSTPGSNPAMYISTTLDNLNIVCNSSPYFTNKPIVFICVGQNFTYNQGAVDPDGDSLVYSLVNPLTNETDSIPFVPGYSATNPISSSPGVTINSSTGDIVMNPTSQEVGVLSVLVEEYRDGLKVGHVVRDMEIYVKPCTNNIPTATGINGTSNRDTSVCPNSQICFDVFSNDIDAGQIVTMTWNHQILNATFTVSGFPHPRGHFCWTPGVNDISSLPHQFTVTVVDNACPNSGYQSYAFTILVNSPLVTIDMTDITCRGQNDGTITVSPVIPGGYSYHWLTGGETTPGISNLPPGSYPVTVYDSTTGCSATFPNTITNPPLLNTSTSMLAGSCPLSDDGVAVASASGGAPPYLYSWNTTPVTLNDTAINLSPGTYYVTITDLRHCVKIDSVTISASTTSLVINFDSVSNLLCYADTIGSITVSASGGTPGYTYVWNTNPVQTTPTATGLSPGTYVVRVTDSLGCSSTDSTTVTSPPQILITGGAVNASCGNSDGIAFVTVSGGIQPYSFTWTGYPSTNDSLFNVQPGLYTVNVTDSNACIGTLDVLVQSQTISSTANIISQVGCRNDSNAIAVATASGGVPPYTYSWTPYGGTGTHIGDTATGLHSGIYVVIITDASSCFTADTVNIRNPPQIDVFQTSINATCDSSGRADVIVSGGIEPYTYSWSPYGGTDPVADSLIPGVYTVTISDAAGCIITRTDTILQNVNIVVTVDSIAEPDCNGSNTGSINISVTGGSGVYMYLWTPGGFTTEDISNVNAGIYTVDVRDQNGCHQLDSITLTQPPPVPAYAGNDTALCAGSSFILEASPVPAGSTGTWISTPQIPDSLFSDIHDPNALLGNIPPGNNVISWKVTDANGCSTTDALDLFNFNLSAGSDFAQCNLDSLQLNATILPNLTGLWSASSNIVFTDPTLNNTFINILNYGVDTLTWTVSGTACNSSDYAIVGAYQVPTADAGDTQTVCSPKVKLMAIVSGPGSGIWSARAPSQATFADSLSPATEAFNLDTGLTVFVWTITNGVCSAADTVLVNYDLTCELQLPSAFSPNGDGFNDGYFIRGIDGYPDNFFSVFNRWGNEVYKKEDYVNTDWKGDDKSGDPLPEGTYFVVLTIKNSDTKRSTFVDLRRYSNK